MASPDTRPAGSVPADPPHTQSLPPTLLFKDFAGLSRAVTPDFYRGVLGREVRRAAVVPAADLLGGG